jgi:2-methylcitrate dehydratase PrpD
VELLERYSREAAGTSIDATLELRNEVRASDIAAIKTGITKYAASRIGDKYPTSIESAKFSMPYVAAYTVLYGPPMLKAFTEEAIRDEKIKEMARKVSIAIDPEFADLLLDSPSRVTVTLNDGRTVQRIDTAVDADEAGVGNGGDGYATDLPSTNSPRSKLICTKRFRYSAGVMPVWRLNRLLKNATSS